MNYINSQANFMPPSQNYIAQPNSMNPQFNQIPTQNATQVNHNVNDNRDLLEITMRRQELCEQIQLDANENNKKNMELQLQLARKTMYRNLPTVTNKGYQWKIFFDAFNETKNYFTDYENISRLQKAIKCEKIMKMGGVNLFNPRTYLSTLSALNERLGKPELLILEEKEKILHLKKVNGDNYHEVIKLIDKVKQYSDLVESVGNTAEKMDLAVISRIYQILPKKLSNAWVERYNCLMNERREVFIRDLAQFLNRHQKTYETGLMFSKLDPLKEHSSKNTSSKNNNEKRNFLFTHHDDDDESNSDCNSSESENENENECVNYKLETNLQKNPSRYCFLHKNSSHSSLTCFSLMAKPAKEVIKLAKEAHLCVKCASKEHKSECRVKIECPIPSCTENHAIIFCSKRKITNLRLRENSKQEKESNNNNTEKDCDQDSLIDALEANNINSANLSFDSWASFNVVDTHMTHNTLQTANTLTSVVVIKLEGNNNNVSVLGALLLDSGSTTSLIEQDFADLLGLKGPKFKISLSWSGDVTRHDGNSQIVKLKATGIQKNAKTFEIFFRTIKNLKMARQNFNVDQMKGKFPHLKDLELMSYSKIIGIIGNDQAHFFEPQKWIRDKKTKNAPIAIMSPLGYSVIGSSIPLSRLYYNLSGNQKNEVLNSNNINLEPEEVIELVKMQEILIGNNCKHTHEEKEITCDDEKALMALKKLVHKPKDDKHFYAPLLWKNEKENLKFPTENSLRTALRRWKILEKHSKRIGKFEDIKCQVGNLLQKDYARVLTSDEVQNPPKHTFYIPIFISTPHNKRSRLIWDAKAKIDGTSLNDLLLQGPNLYVDMIKILTQMREHKVLIKGDIGEMFHQVKILKEDRSALRFVACHNDSNKPQFYEMKVLVFGIVCAPTISQFVKNKIADDNKIEYPDACELIKAKTYVDDLVFSIDSIKKGSQIIYEIKNLLKKGGFDLLKLKSTNESVFNTLKDNLSEQEKYSKKLFSQEESEKVLGYIIDFQADTLSLNFHFNKFPIQLRHDQLPTKKLLLQVLMSIYDPLGFFAFLTVNLKIIFHMVCKDKIDWHEIIGIQHAKNWEKCLNWLSEIVQIKIPRCYFSLDCEKGKNQLILCGDAGIHALCVVAYIRIINEIKNKVDYVFVGSKTFINPLKQKRSIPELELDIADKSVKFAEKLVNWHSINFDKIYFMTDSACVFYWIKNGVRKESVFVKNRLNRIKQKTTNDQWMWISTKFQPANYGTKIEAMPKLTHDNDWFCPKIFLLPEDDWFGKLPPEEKYTLPVNSNVCEEHTHEKIIDFTRFSKLSKLINVVTLILRWKSRTQVLALESKIKNEKMTRNLIAVYKDKIEKIHEENRLDKLSEKGEKLLVRLAQSESFQAELHNLKKGNPFSKSSIFYKLDVTLDKHSILRVSTRLNETEFEFDRTNPILLPRDHKLTELIVMKQHENLRHAHKNILISKLSQKYFIPKIKQTVSKLLSTCVMCKKLKKEKKQPMMGDLPLERLSIGSPAFLNIIIDVCGHFYVRVGRKSEKRWLLVISCLTTRACHIEILHKMDTNECLMALQNFINLRGCPLKIISDPGSNFVGGMNVTNSLLAEWNNSLKRKGIITDNIVWEMSPPKGSNFNGSVERMVALIKKVLVNSFETLNKNMVFPNDSSFRCLINEIINMMNNRPLVVDAKLNEDFLTPNHFLILRKNNMACPIKDSKNNRNLVQDWEDIKIFMSRTWEFFAIHYVEKIKYRTKWYDKQDNFQIGDLVIVADPTVANLWRLGKIIEAKIGSKNQTRRVKILLGKRESLPLHLSKEDIKKLYMKENHSIIERPTALVAKFI
jgi:hypothetical protein